MGEKKVNDILAFMDNMSEHDFRTKSREICKTIVLDKKMLEDGYITKRKNYEEATRKLLEELEKEDPKAKNRLSSLALDSYFELIKQESMREYNRRLIRIILG